MGYNAMITEANFTIPAGNLDAACQALKNLNKSDDGKSGGYSWEKDAETVKSFRGMDSDYDQKLHSAEDILKELGFGLVTTGDGDLMVTDFDQNSGDEQLFLAALAPFVPAGSYINWEGDDGQRWQDYFDGATHTEKVGVTTYV